MAEECRSKRTHETSFTSALTMLRRRASRSGRPAPRSRVSRRLETQSTRPKATASRWKRPTTTTFRVMVEDGRTIRHVETFYNLDADAEPFAEIRLNGLTFAAPRGCAQQPPLQNRGSRCDGHAGRGARAT